MNNSVAGPEELPAADRAGSDAAESKKTLLGRVDHCEDGVVFGWAVFSEGPAEPVTVELFLNGEPVARAIANKPRGDLEALRIGDGKFGFRLTVPSKYRDGVRRNVVVREVTTGISIDSDPLEFSGEGPSKGPRDSEGFEDSDVAQFVAGFVDECSPEGVVGWAARSDGSRLPVEVELLVDRVQAARLIADLPRGDLAASGVGGGSGHHGFRLQLPEGMFDDKPHQIEVREVSTRQRLEQGAVIARFNVCHLWARSADTEEPERRALASKALAYLEAAPDDALNAELHEILLRLHAWLEAQGSSRPARRAQRQLDRIAEARWRVNMKGFLDARQIGGSIVDSWADVQPIELELVEDRAAVAEPRSVVGSCISASGSFAFELPQELFDDEVHRFAIRVKAFAGILGTWSFLLTSVAGHNTASSRSKGYDPVWDTVPAVAAELKAKHLRTEPAKQELIRIALQDALAAEGPDVAAPREIAQLHCDLGDLLLESGRWAEASAQFEGAVDLDPGSAAGFVGRVRCLLAGNDEAGATRELAAALQTFPEDRELHTLSDDLRGRQRVNQVRLVAFYLPQFHPVPENDEWWGKGFTEWSNVATSEPLFEGHLQPRRPTSLGFYDLRLPEAANAQFELAARYGIDGFCYYYYWFNGRKILERPLQDLVSGRTGPFPFCICWANEPWTRSWDGVTGEVLVAQNHTPESDFEFIRDLAPLLRHKDYIRVSGKPVVMVYRADKLATPRDTVERWREWCRAEGIGELHLCAVEAFGFYDPRPLGFDAAVEFPPHSPSTVYPDYDYHQEISDVPGRVTGFRAKVFSYQVFASGGMKRPREPFLLHRTAMVAWDNTARRQKAAHVFHGFSLDTFERWVLSNARKAAIEQDDAVCFVNAWNEWAEGSVMEPDAHFGYEILEASRRAKAIANLDSRATFWLDGSPHFPESRLAQRERILLVGHDAFRSGAQINLLNMARALKRQLDMDLVIILVEGGDLVEEYERVAPTYVIGREGGWRASLKTQLRRYRALGAHKAICNTVATGEVTEVLKEEGYRVVSLVHELPALIESYDLSSKCWILADKADNVVFASRFVADEFCNRYWPSSEKVAIAPQGITFNSYHDQRALVRKEVLEELRLSDDCVVVLGCGHADTRKGIDLFVQMASEVARRCSPAAVAFVWIGALEWQLAPYIQSDVARLGLSNVFRVTGQTNDPARYFIAGDIFALTSREDPFPSVVMEAFDAKLPVVAFAGGGGYVDIVGEQTGALVPYLDVSAMARAILKLIQEKERRVGVGQHNHALARERFGYQSYMRKVLALLSGVPAQQVTGGQTQRQKWFSQRPRPTITAIVPNYNYGRYLELRLRTVLGQTLAPDEVIVLDDASSDHSLDIIRAITKSSSVPVQVVTSNRNSGNPFTQWAKGLSKAKGELIWIAEADDYCEPSLLETLVSEFEDDKIVMAWTDSVMVDEQGGSQGAQYKSYYARNYGGKWHGRFRMQGARLIDDCLLAENVLPNASAVLFRRAAVTWADVLKIQKYRFSGDWWFWLSLALAGDVAYNPSPLNYHRRHSKSVMDAVLRAGESLLPETLSFYQRVAADKPECITSNTRSQVLDRLRQLFERFPALRASASRIGDHPALASQYRELTQAFARAIERRGRRQAAGVTLVLSSDVLAPDALGGSLVRYFVAVQSSVHVIVIADETAASQFIEELRLPGVTHTVLPDSSLCHDSDPERAATRGSVSKSEQLVRAALDEHPGTRLVTHGLLAHCVVGSAVDSVAIEWLLLGGAEFNVLLGYPPKERNVTVTGLRHAMSRCTEARFFGKAPPHAFARLAQECKKAIDEMPLSANSRRGGMPGTVRCLAVASHATVNEWNDVSRALYALEDTHNCVIRLLLLAWGEALDNLQTSDNLAPNIELVHVYNRPTSLPMLGDLLLLPDSERDVRGSSLELQVEGSRMRAFKLAALLSASSAGHSSNDVSAHIASLLASGGRLKRVRPDGSPGATPTHAKGRG